MNRPYKLTKLISEWLSSKHPFCKATIHSSYGYDSIWIAAGQLVIFHNGIVTVNRHDQLFIDTMLLHASDPDFFSKIENKLEL